MDIAAKVKEIVSDKLDVDPTDIQENKDFVEDLKADSLAIVEVVLALRAGALAGEGDLVTDGELGELRFEAEIREEVIELIEADAREAGSRHELPQF